MHVPFDIAADLDESLKVQAANKAGLEADCLCP